MESKKNSPHTFKIYAEKRLTEYLRARDAQVQARIDQDSDDYLANADETSYIQRLVNEFCLAVPYLDFGRVSASTGKKRVPAERFPPNQFHVRKGQSYEKGVVIFHIPCTGDVELLRYYTDSFITEDGPLGFIEDNHLCFETINFHDDLKRVKKSSESVMKDIKTLSSKVIEEIESPNYNLEWNIRHKLQERKRNLSQVAEVLGVPIRKSENVRTEPSATRLPQTDNEISGGESNNSYDVFLSYASGDSKEAQNIYDLITAAGGKAFLSEKSLRAGDDFAEAIRKALHASIELWLLLSPNSLRSEWVISERRAAWVLRKRIIPILFRRAPTDAPDRIRRLHCVDFHNCPALIKDRFPPKVSM